MKSSSSILSIAVVSLLAGLTAGVASGLWGTDLFSAASKSPTEALAVGAADLPSLEPADAPQPSAEVDNLHYNFGHMERFAKGQHAFVIKNVGQGTLRLEKGRTTCKCTLSEITMATIEPGQSTEIKLEWEARGDSPEFRHGATIYTNDREHRVLSLDIEGTLVDALALNPPEIVFSNISADEQITGKSRLATIRSDNLAVVSHTFENEETARFFQVDTRPLAADELPDGTKSGCEVNVTVKPGLPPGPIQQKIRLQTNVPDSSPVDLKIDGRVGTPVMIVGRSKEWNQDTGTLRLGVVSREKGATSELKVMIRGPHRQQIQLRPKQADPEWLEVTIGERQDLGTVVAVPVTIHVPPHSPTVNRIGNDTGAVGTVLLESDPPELGEIRLNVGFVVAE